MIQQEFEIHFLEEVFLVYYRTLLQKILFGNFQNPFDNFSKMMILMFGEFDFIQLIFLRKFMIVSFSDCDKFEKASKNSL